MSTLKNAGKPATTPRAASAKTTEYVCIHPEYVCNLDCHECQYYVQVPDEGDDWPDNCSDCMKHAAFDCRDCFKNNPKPLKASLVTKRADQVEAGVTKDYEGLPGKVIVFEDDLVTVYPGQALPGVTKCNEDDCISPPTFTSLHIFTSWDDVDSEIQRCIIAANCHDRWDISRWRFTDNPPHGWINELCYVPQKSFIEVEWGFINV